MLADLLILLAKAIDIYVYIVIAAVLMSWLVLFNVVNPNNPTMRQIMRYMAMATEPPLSRIRKLVPVFPGGFDLSPVILIFGLMLIKNLLVGLAIGAIR